MAWVCRLRRLENHALTLGRDAANLSEVSAFQQELGASPGCPIPFSGQKFVSMNRAPNALGNACQLKREVTVSVVIL